MQEFRIDGGATDKCVAQVFVSSDADGIHIAPGDAATPKLLNEGSFLHVVHDRPGFIPQ